MRKQLPRLYVVGSFYVIESERSLGRKEKDPIQSVVAFQQAQIRGQRRGKGQESEAREF
jgi:hypothetical protein